MLDKSINLLDEVDNLSKIHWLERDDVDVIMKDFAKQIVLSLKIERINIWLFNKERTAIVSIGEWDIRTKEFKKDSKLYKKNYPSYFKALEKNKIILAENIHTDPVTQEFDDDYSKPLGIESLMDVPLRIGGDLVGVICFEQVGTKRKFTPEEQSFAVSVSLVVSSTLEARQRRAAQHHLDRELIEKDRLIKEINYRVKNNFGILLSLLDMSKEKGGIADPKIVLEEYEQRILAMLKIHEILSQSQSHTSVSLSDYLIELVNEFKKTHPEISHGIIEHIDIVNCYLPTKEAMYVGLIVNEIFLNSIKYSIKDGDYRLFIGVSEDRGKKVHVKIGDNGSGFDFNEKLKRRTLGLQLIKDLSADMELVSKFPTLKDNMYEFTLPAN